jgi:hypothetical protein
MTHDTPAHYDANGMMTQMRSILNQFDEERREIDVENINLSVDMFVGLMIRILEELWELVRRSDVKRPKEPIRLGQYYQARACAAVIGDLCRQPDWDNDSGPGDWDTYNQTIRTLRWLLELFDE